MENTLTVIRLHTLLSLRCVNSVASVTFRDVVHFRGESELFVHISSSVHTKNDGVHCTPKMVCMSHLTVVPIRTPC